MSESPAEEISDNHQQHEGMQWVRKRNHQHSSGSNTRLLSCKVQIKVNAMCTKYIQASSASASPSILQSVNQFSKSFQRSLTTLENTTTFYLCEATFCFNRKHRLSQTLCSLRLSGDSSPEMGHSNYYIMFWELRVAIEYIFLVILTTQIASISPVSEKTDATYLHNVTNSNWNWGVICSQSLEWTKSWPAAPRLWKTNSMQIQYSYTLV